MIHIGTYFKTAFIVHNCSERVNHYSVMSPQNNYLKPNEKYHAHPHFLNKEQVTFLSKKFFLSFFFFCIIQGVHTPSNFRVIYLFVYETVRNFSGHEALRYQPLEDFHFNSFGYRA